MKMGPKRKIVRTENQDGMYVDVLLECGHTTTRRHRYADHQDSCFCYDCLKHLVAPAKAQEEATEEVAPVVRIYDPENYA